METRSGVAAVFPKESVKLYVPSPRCATRTGKGEKKKEEERFRRRREIGDLVDVARRR